MDYKKIYTPDELRDVCEWMASHIPGFPESLQLDDATFIPDLHQTVEQLILLAKKHYNSPTYGGQLLLLFRIREKMEGAVG